MDRIEDLEALLTGCTWPSEALWRSLELDVLRSLSFERPILELGCGDGHFTELLLDHVEEAIDVNPRSVERARGRGDLYGEVRCLDAADLANTQPAQFGTLFANCVLEHIADLPAVLNVAAHVLRLGGRLITTVPLLEMNRHLLLRTQWYAELRRRQLAHHNLWNPDEWRRRLRAAGFTPIEVVPYLGPTMCRLWDALDFPACIGVGRYRTGALARQVFSTLVPRVFRDRLRRTLAVWLARKIGTRGRLSDPACAALLVAVRST
jgi:SAM-dependent methyltransferase